MQHTCAHCAQTFSGRRRRRYCSAACSGAARRRGLDLPCFTCGAGVRRPHWRLKLALYTFCSPECRSEGWADLQARWRAFRTGGDLLAAP